MAKKKRPRPISGSGDAHPDPPATKRVDRHLVKYTTEQVNQVFDRFLDKVNPYPLSSRCHGNDTLSPLWLTWLVEYEGVREHICLPPTVQPPTQTRLEELVSKKRSGAEIAQWVSARYLADLSLTFRISNPNRPEDAQIVKMNTVNLKDALRSCTQPVAVLLLDLDPEPDTEYSAHRGALIFNFNEQTYERFEPLGWFMRGVDDYLDSNTFRRDAGLSDNWTYIAPYHVCPIIGLQDVAGIPSHCPENSGFCVVFTMIYIHLRMLMPLNEPEEIINLLLELESTQLRQLAQKYDSWMNTEVQQGIWLGDNQSGQLERKNNRAMALLYERTPKLAQGKKIWTRLEALVLGV
jgi:hypothetical protein